MLFFVVTGYSETSAGEAVSNALGISAGIGGDAESIHVIVLGVAKTGSGWQATVKVVIEPKARPEKDKRHEDEDELRHKEEKEARDEEERTARVHLYAHEHMDLAEVVHHLHMMDYDIFYPHFIAEGPLWNEVLHYYPDVDFYEAAHPEGVMAYKTAHPDIRLELENFVENLKSVHPD